MTSDLCSSSPMSAIKGPRVFALTRHVIYNMRMYLCIAELAKGLASASLCSVTHLMNAHQMSSCKNMSELYALPYCPTLAHNPGALRACRSTHVGGRFMFLYALIQSHLVSACGWQLGLFWKARVLTVWRLHA